jgi:hypothetical protein
MHSSIANPIALLTPFGGIARSLQHKSPTTRPTQHLVVTIWWYHKNGTNGLLYQMPGC